MIFSAIFFPEHMEETFHSISAIILCFYLTQQEVEMGYE